MEGTVQNVKLDMVGLNWRRRFTDHNAEGEATALTTADNNIKDKHDLCTAGEDSMHLPSIN